MQYNFNLPVTVVLVRVYPFTGLDYWTGIRDWTTGLGGGDMDGFGVGGGGGGGGARRGSSPTSV